MKRFLLPLALLIAAPVFAQTHPCDGTPPTSGTAVAGTPVTLTTCHSGRDTNNNVITITGWAVYDNGARTTPTLTPSATVNAAGLRAYTLTFNAPNTAILHTYETAAISSAGESAKSVPFGLTVSLPITVPVAPVKTHVQ